MYKIHFLVSVGFPETELFILFGLFTVFTSTLGPGGGGESFANFRLLQLLYISFSERAESMPPEQRKQYAEKVK